MHADSLLIDLGGNQPTVTASNASVVFNRTEFRDCVQVSSEVEFQPLDAGGPNAGQYLHNGLIVASGPSSNFIVQVCTPPHSQMTCLSSDACSRLNGVSVNRCDLPCPAHQCMTLPFESRLNKPSRGTGVVYSVPCSTGHLMSESWMSTKSALLVNLGFCGSKCWLTNSQFLWDRFHLTQVCRLLLVVSSAACIAFGWNDTCSCWRSCRHV